MLFRVTLMHWLLNLKKSTKMVTITSEMKFATQIVKFDNFSVTRISEPTGPICP